MEKKLGKIQSVEFGIGGYQDAMIGIHVTLGGDGWGVGHSTSEWDANIIDCTEHSKWTEADRSRKYDEIIRYISGLLKQAKVGSVDKLKGIPIECTFDGNLLKGWKILEEVL